MLVEEYTLSIKSIESTCNDSAHVLTATLLAVRATQVRWNFASTELEIPSRLTVLSKDCY